MSKGIEETTEHLELFFRNLLLGESNVLQSRYLIVGGWKGPDDPASNVSTPTSNSATPTSNVLTPTSKNSGNWALSEAVRRLLLVLGEEELTRGELMRALKLKDRKNFLEYSLGPALRIGLVEMTQPDSPRSPTQRYRLTVWGQKAKGSQGAVHLLRHQGVRTS